MKFTPELPTQPGLHRWKESEEYTDILIDVQFNEIYTNILFGTVIESGEGTPISRRGGLWSQRLEPVKSKCIYASVERLRNRLIPACSVNYLGEVWKDKIEGYYKYCPMCGGEIEFKP